MSRKPRKKPAKTARKRSEAPAAGAHADAPPQESKSGLDIPEEYVHVPKQTSPLRFVLMVLLVIVLLIIFVAPQALQSALTGGGSEEEAYVTWDQPGEGTVELSYPEFVQEKRRLQNALAIPRLLRFQLGILGRTPSDEEVVRFLFLDRMAESAGMHVSDADLAAFLRQEVTQQFGGADTYVRWAQRNGGAPAIEETLRRCLRGLRTLQVAASMGGLPDPARIEELWADEHVEMALDLVHVHAADLLEDARAELPPDEDLQAWFDALAEPQRLALQEPERRRGEFALFDGEGEVAQLLTSYPEPEDAVAEERAREYYDRVFFRRFLRPEDETTEEETDPAQPPQRYLSFEEVQETCAMEAPVYFAMTAWLRDMRERLGNGETPDLKAEAEGFGLRYEVMDEAKGVMELRESDEASLGGTAFSNAVFQAQPDQFAPTVVAGPTLFAVARVVEVLPPAIPPFADIREAVVEMWVGEQSAEIALDRLRGVRAGFSAELPEGVEEQEPRLGPDGQELERRFTDEASFRAAAEGAGFEVVRRDWLDVADPNASDPNLEPAADAYLRSRRELAQLAEGEVTEPALEPGHGAIYLIRSAGQREVPIERMNPGQYESYKQRSARNLSQVLLLQPSVEELETRYGMVFLSRTAEDEEELEGEESAPSE